MNSFKLRSKPL